MTQYAIGSYEDHIQQAEEHEQDALMSKRFALALAVGSGALAATGMIATIEGGPNVITGMAAFAGSAIAGYFAVEEAGEISDHILSAAEERQMAEKVRY